MSSRQLSILPKKCATIAVLESGSHVLRYPELSARPALEKCAIPWATYEYFSEDEINDFFRGIESSRFSAVIIGLGALQIPAVAARLNCESAVSLIRARNLAGMGIVVSQTFSSASTRLLSFLPEQLSIWAEPIKEAHQTQVIVAQGDLSKIAGATPPGKGAPERADVTSGPVILLAFLSSEHASRHRALATTKAGQAVLIESTSPGGRVFVTTLHPTQIDTNVLSSVLIECLRPTGIMLSRNAIARAETTDRYYLAWLAGQSRMVHLSEAHSKLDDLSFREASCSFAHVALDESMSWNDIGTISRPSLLRLLESGGSLTAATSGRGGIDPWLSLHGPTPSMNYAESIADILIQNEADVLSSSLLVLRAVSRVAAALDNSISVTSNIPAGIQKYSLGLMLEPVLRKRLGKTSAHNVDGALLPTAALYCICQSLGVEAGSPDSILKWIHRELRSAPAASILQAACWIPEIRALSEVTTALESSAIDRFELQPHVLSLQAFTSEVAILSTSWASGVLDVMTSADASRLAKVMLAESVLSAADEREVESPSVAEILRSTIAAAWTELDEALLDSGATPISESYLLSIAAHIRRDAQSRLGVRSAGPATNCGTASLGGRQSQSPRTVEQEVAQRELARDLESTSLELGRLRQFSRVLVIIFLALLLSIFGIIAVNWGQPILGWIESNGFAQELVLLGIPLLLATTGTLIYKILSPYGVLPNFMRPDYWRF